MDGGREEAGLGKDDDISFPLLKTECLHSSDIGDYVDHASSVGRAVLWGATARGDFLAEKTTRIRGKMLRDYEYHGARAATNRDFSQEKFTLLRNASTNIRGEFDLERPIMHPMRE